MSNKRFSLSKIFLFLKFKCFKLDSNQIMLISIFFSAVSKHSVSRVRIEVSFTKILTEKLFVIFFTIGVSKSYKKQMCFLEELIIQNIVIHFSTVVLL